MPELECIAGDTLPSFTVSLTQNGEQLSGTSEQSLKVTISGTEVPTIAVITKEAELVDGKFVVKLTSDDTSQLRGDYILIFSLHDSDDLVYRKIMGGLHVHPAPKE